MRTTEVALLAVRMGALGLLWALSYLIAVRFTPLDAIPVFLHQRVRRTRALAPYVAAASLFVLAAGVIATIRTNS